MGGTQLKSGHPNVSFTFCFSSHLIIGSKYFISEDASIFLVPIASSSTSGQGLEEPDWRIFLDGGRAKWCYTFTASLNPLFTLCIINNEEPSRFHTLKWSQLLRSWRCRMCARDPCDWLPRTASREAGTAGWNWQNTCRGKNIRHLFSALYLQYHKHKK